MLIELDNLNAAKEHWDKIRSQPWFKDQASGAFIKRQPLAYEQIPILNQRIKELEDKLGSLEPKKGNGMDEHTDNVNEVATPAEKLEQPHGFMAQERPADAKDGEEVKFEQDEEHLGKEDETTLVN